SIGYTDTTVSATTSYTYRVRAYNDYFVSGWTNEITANTMPSPPAAPTGLSGSVYGTQVTLSWTNHSNNETAYEIYRKTGSGSYTLVGLLVPTSTSFTDTGVSAGTSYTYRVRAANDLWASGFTNEVSVTPGP